MEDVYAEYESRIITLSKMASLVQYTATPQMLAFFRVIYQVTWNETNLIKLYRTLFDMKKWFSENLITVGDFKGITVDFNGQCRVWVEYLFGHRQSGRIHGSIFPILSITTL